MLRRSRAHRAWQTGRDLRARHVPVPDPLAFLERRRCGLLQASYLVTRAVAAAENLDRFVEKRFAIWPLDEKRAFISRLAGLLKAAHDQGMVHGDLKAKNILVAADSGAEQLFWFIDLDAALLRPEASFSDRCRDLARLNCSFLNTALVSRTLRLLFLQSYHENDLRAELKIAWKMVLEYSWRKLLKSERAFSG
jgi:tRNA A-37 threonylcarbamoyl transferase component Bud32